MYHYLSCISRNNHLFTNGDKTSDVYDIETGATYGPNQVYTKKDSKNNPGGPLTLRFDKSPDSSRTNTEKPWNLITKTRLGFVRGPNWKKSKNKTGYQTIMTFNKNITLKYYDFAFLDNVKDNSKKCTIKLEYWDEDKKEWMLMHLYSPMGNRHICIPFFGYERLFNSANYGKYIMNDIKYRQKNNPSSAPTGNDHPPMGRLSNSEIHTDIASKDGASLDSDDLHKSIYTTNMNHPQGNSWYAKFVGGKVHHSSVFAPEIYPTLPTTKNADENGQFVDFPYIRPDEVTKHTTKYSTPHVQYAHNFAPIRPWARPCVDLRHTYIYDCQPIDSKSLCWMGNMQMTRRVHPQLKPSKYFKFSVHHTDAEYDDTSQICFMRMYGKIHHDIILPTETEWISGGIQQKGSYTYDHRIELG